MAFNNQPDWADYKLDNVKIIDKNYFLLLSMNQYAKQFPIDVLTFVDSDNNLPIYLNNSLKNSWEKGFYTLPITPDNYNIKPHHCGFKHLKDITIPKIDKIINNISGFFIAEGDLYINDDFNFKLFLDMKIKEPTWLGYKKKLSNYIVGNFLIYIPSTYYKEFKSKLEEEKRLIFSDRFFSKLYFSGWLKLTPKSYATEIEHFSNIIGTIRKSDK